MTLSSTEPVKTNEEAPNSPKLYSLNQIIGSMFLGTISSGGVLIALNYKELGDVKKARLAIIVTTCIFIFLIGCFPLLLISSGLSLGLFGLSIGLCSKIQGKILKEHKENGGANQNWSSVLMFSIPIGVVNFYLIKLSAPALTVWYKAMFAN